ncbi:MAG: hypothetical protein GTO14_00690 [Anaerolineales bacterium]|nr:hypothetical protein [Anaerolineales bacterium]
MYGDHDPVKMLLTYDPLPGRREAYLRYVRGEFVPTLEHMGLTMSESWHTAYGAYPLRLASFLASDRATMERIIASDTFQELETKLQEFVANYNRKIVPHRSTFQY